MGDKNRNIIWNIRFRRVPAGIYCRSRTVAVRSSDAGSHKIPLADPGVLGISSGASAGAVCAMVLGMFSIFGGYSVIVGATAGVFDYYVHEDRLFGDVSHPPSWYWQE